MWDTELFSMFSELYNTEVENEMAFVIVESKSYLRHI